MNLSKIVPKVRKILINPQFHSPVLPSFYKSWSSLYIFQSSVAFYVETSHSICSANQMTGFYIEMQN